MKKVNGSRPTGSRSTFSPSTFFILHSSLIFVAFLILATLNSAGYRYGASDQAFYIPAVVLRLDPSLFPDDRVVIGAQAYLTAADDVVAAMVRATGLSVPAVCAVLYGASLALLAAGGWSIARRLYRTTWTAVALLAALTMRHAIPDSGTNTLEGYFHPRQLAFALGTVALAAFLRGRLAAAALLVLAGAAMHPTTALWLTIWLAVAVFVSDRRLRVPVAAGAAAAAALSVWAVAWGPLAARLSIMDATWLSAIAEKEYLFPLEWSADAWIVNLAYIPVIVWTYRWRVRAGVALPRERGFVVGCLSLVPVFAAAVPLITARVALAIQLQPARIFWMLDLLATAYVVWAIGEGARPESARPKIAAVALALLSLGRGLYVKVVEFPNRPIAELDLPDNDWGRVMRWARTTDPASGWLADPIHAARYGTSVRLAGHRDVYVEALKDIALGMYDRGVALRTQDRLAALGDFHALTPSHARALGERHGLGYLVTEQHLDLPVAFHSGSLNVYRLRAAF
jgi:hypothetical protein